MIVRDYVRNYQTNEEFFKVKEKNGKIKGVATIELFDAKTNDLIIEAKSHNIIYAQMYEQLAFFQWYKFMKESGLHIVWSSVPKHLSRFLSLGIIWGTIWLTTSSLGEHEIDCDIRTYDEKILVGDLIWGLWRDGVESLDVYFGRTVAHFVFNLSTNMANGTFNTILWDCGEGNYLHPDTIYTNLFPINEHGYRFKLVGDQFYIINRSGQMYKFTRDMVRISGPIDTDLISSGKFSLCFASDGNYLYGLDWNGKFIKTNKNGEAVDSPKYLGITTNQDICFGLCYVDGYLYALDGFGKLYKISRDGFLIEGPISTEIESMITEHNDGGVDITTDGTNLYATDTYGDVFKISKDGRFLGEFITYYNPNYYNPNYNPSNYVPLPMEFDGRNFYMLSYLGDCLKYSRYYHDWIARTLLPQPITKTNTQTMRLTYDFMRY